MTLTTPNGFTLAETLWDQWLQGDESALYPLLDLHEEQGDNRTEKQLHFWALRLSFTKDEEMSKVQCVLADSGFLSKAGAKWIRVLANRKLTIPSLSGTPFRPYGSSQQQKCWWFRWNHWDTAYVPANGLPHEIFDKRENKTNTYTSMQEAWKDVLQVLRTIREVTYGSTSKRGGSNLSTLP
jgi:hypothetical protein